MIEGDPVEDGGRSSTGKSRQKIMKLKQELNSQKLITKTSQELQADRIRQLKESYDLAVLKADEMMKSQGNNVYQKVHGDRAKRVYTAISSLIYSTISFTKAKGLEDYIRQNAVTLPSTMIDLEEWDYVLQMAQECRESLIIRNTPRQEIPFDLQKKIDLCQYLAIQPLRNTKDEVQILRQSVLDQLNEFFSGMHQSMSAVMHHVEEIRAQNRKDANLAKAKQLEQVCDGLRQQVLDERRKGQDEVLEVQKSCKLEVESLKAALEEAKAHEKSTVEELEANHTEEVNHLKARIDILTRDLLDTQEKNRAKDRKIAAQSSTIEDLERALATERNVSKRLRERQEMDVLEVVSSCTSDSVIAQAVNINTFFKDFREPEKIHKALSDFEVLKIEMAGLQKAHEQVMEQRLALEKQVETMDHELHNLQSQLLQVTTTAETDAAEHVQTVKVLETTLQNLQRTLEAETEDHRQQASAAATLEATLKQQLDTLSAELATLVTQNSDLSRENATLHKQNEDLHREKQDLRIENLQRENEKIIAIQQHVSSLVVEQQDIKNKLQSSAEEKDNQLRQALSQETEKIVALESHIESLTNEIQMMKRSMNDLRESTTHDAAALRAESDKVDALHEFTIDTTTRIFELKAVYDHLTHEKDKVVQLIKVGEIVHSDDDPRVQQVRTAITTDLWQPVRAMQDRMRTLIDGIDLEHLSEGAKHQHVKLLSQSKNLDRLLWEVEALQLQLDDAALPHEPEPGAALHIIKKLEAQVVEWQSKHVNAEERLESQAALISSLQKETTEKDAVLANLNKQIAQHIALLQEAWSQVQDLVQVVEGETSQALMLFQAVQLLEEELQTTQTQLNISEEKMAAIVQKLQGAGNGDDGRLDAEEAALLHQEHADHVALLEAKITALELTLKTQQQQSQASGRYVSFVNANGVEERRRSVGFADERNEVRLIRDASSVATSMTSVTDDADAVSEGNVDVVCATKEEEEKKEEIETEQKVASPSVVSTSSESVVSPDIVVEQTSDVVSGGIVTIEEEDSDASSVPFLSLSTLSPRPESAGSGRRSPGQSQLFTPRTAAHYAAQRQVLDIVKRALAHFPSSTISAATASASVSPSVSPSSMKSAAPSSTSTKSAASAEVAAVSIEKEGGVQNSPTVTKDVSDTAQAVVSKEKIPEESTASTRGSPSAVVTVDEVASVAAVVDPETAIEPVIVEPNVLRTTADVSNANNVNTEQDVDAPVFIDNGMIVSEKKTSLPPDLLPPGLPSTSGDDTSIHSQHSEIMDTMVPCAGTVQGQTGWYRYTVSAATDLSHHLNSSDVPAGENIDGDRHAARKSQQYFFFCRDDVFDDFLLLCGPLSAAQYTLAQRELLQATSLADVKVDPALDTTAHPRHARDLCIDRLAIHATRLQMETLLNDIQSRDEYIDTVLLPAQGQQQRDIGLLLGKLAEYEAEIFALRQLAPPPLEIAKVPEKSEASSVDKATTSQPQVAEDQQLLSASVDQNASVGSTDTDNLGNNSVSGRSGLDAVDRPLAPDREFVTLFALEDEEVDPALLLLASSSSKYPVPATAVGDGDALSVAIPSSSSSAVAAGVSAAQVLRLKVARSATDDASNGVLVAMGNTRQGESGWYAGPNGDIFYFVLRQGQWIYAAGPLSPTAFQNLLQDAITWQRRLLLNHQHPALTPSARTSQRQQQQQQQKEQASRTATKGALLMPCNFRLTGIQGDLAESGDVYLHLETLQLHLSLQVEDLMVALQQGSGQQGGGNPNYQLDPDDQSLGDRSGNSWDSREVWDQLQSTQLDESPQPVEEGNSSSAKKSKKKKKKSSNPDEVSPDGEKLKKKKKKKTLPPMDTAASTSSLSASGMADDVANVSSAVPLSKEMPPVDLLTQVAGGGSVMSLDEAPFGEEGSLDSLGSAGLAGGGVESALLMAGHASVDKMSLVSSVQGEGSIDSLDA